MLFWFIYGNESRISSTEKFRRKTCTLWIVNIMAVKVNHWSSAFVIVRKLHFHFNCGYGRICSIFFAGARFACSVRPFFWSWAKSKVSAERSFAFEKAPTLGQKRFVHSKHDRLTENYQWLNFQSLAHCRRRIERPRIPYLSFQIDEVSTTPECDTVRRYLFQNRKYLRSIEDRNLIHSRRILITFEKVWYLLSKGQ